jgi:hypothetical protein
MHYSRGIEPRLATARRGAGSHTISQWPFLLRSLKRVHGPAPDQVVGQIRRR